MPRINDLVKKRGRKLLRPRTELPTWWGLGLGAIGVVLALWIAWGLISPPPDTPDTAEATTPASIATVPSDITPITVATTQPASGSTTSPTSSPTSAPGSTTPGTTAPVAGEVVELVTNAGAVAKVPAGAVSAAGAAALGTASGANAVVVETTLRSAPAAGSNVWYLDVRIDPDGASAAPTTVVKLRCYPVAGGWAVEAA